MNEDFNVGELLGCEYVRATVDIKMEQLKVYYREYLQRSGFLYGPKGFMG